MDKNDFKYHEDVFPAGEEVASTANDEFNGGAGIDGVAIDNLGVLPVLEEWVNEGLWSNDD